MKEKGSSSSLTPKDRPKFGSPPLRHCTRSFGSSTSSISTTPSPSPSHCLHSPLPRSSSIPFSWEHRPGIPKTPEVPSPQPDPLLPLPPPLRSNSEPFTSAPRKKRADVRFPSDPFAAALAECSKDSPLSATSELDEFWRRGAAAAAPRRRAFPTSISDRFGLVGLYGSCKASCSVAQSTVRIPRSNPRSTASYGPLNRRSD